MKLLILGEDTYPGGVDTFIATLINTWPSPSDEISLIFNVDHPGVDVIRDRLERPCRIETQHLWSNHRLNNALDGHTGLAAVKKACTPLLKYLFFAWHVVTLRTLLLAQRPDRLLVVNGGYPGSDVCRAAVVSWRLFSGKPKAVFSIHNLALPMRWFERIQERLVDYGVGRAAGAIVAVSDSCRDALLTREALVSRNRPVRVYNGLGEPRSRPVQAADRAAVLVELGLPTQARVCLMLATYEPRKGHPFLIRAFERVAAAVPDACLVMCGQGTADETRVVADLIARSPAASRMRLFAFRNDVDRLLSHTDVLLVPSQEYESFGLVCLEAFQHRVPVVATRVGGLPEVIGEAGVLVRRDDAEAFASATIELLCNEDLRRTVGDQGLERYRAHFTAGRMTREYAALLQ